MDLDEYMAATVARLHRDERSFDWVGVYVVESNTLALGPYEGKPTEHDRIPAGQGVCGAVAASGLTEIVPDVRIRPGHIACDLNTRSEVVVPIVVRGEVFGVLDVDSAAIDAFGEREIGVIERAAKEIAARV